MCSFGILWMGNGKINMGRIRKSIYLNRLLDKLSGQSSLTLAVEWNMIMAGISSAIKAIERNADSLLASIIGETV